MSTLIVAPETPLPATRGSRVRVLHLARRLAEAGSVEVGALGDVPSVREAFALRGMGSPRAAHVALATSLRQPYQAARHTSRSMRRLAADPRWRTIQVEHSWCMPAVAHAHAPVVLDAHNVEADLLRSIANIETRTLRRARWQWEARKTADLERTAARQVAAVCVTSDDDAEVFERHGARRVVIVPNGVDTTAVTWARPSSEPCLLYLANFDYQPNVSAAAELAREVLPRVRRTVAAARLRLVGEDSGRQLSAMVGPGVEIVGTVPEVSSELHSARVLVVPVRAGSGTRLKVLEAMAAGTPVVSTTFGVSGLAVRAGEHVLIADTPADLARGVVTVLNDDTLARRLSEAGRRLVERRYDWSIVARPLIELHRDLRGG